MADKERKIIGENLKHLRKLKGITQQDLADALGIRRSNIGAYEESRADPKFPAMESISIYFNLPIDMLVKEDLSRFSTMEELRKYLTTNAVDITGKTLRVLPVTVTQEGRQNVDVVNQKASAGYLNGFSDPDYIEELPKFSLPILGPGTYRAFEISGDSMLPMPDGSIIIAEYVNDWRDIKDGMTYIVLSESEGLVYKRVHSNIKSDNTGFLKLVSDNPIYDPIEIPVQEVRELWKAKMYLSNEFPQPDAAIENLTSMVLSLQKEVMALKTKGGPVK